MAQELRLCLHLDPILHAELVAGNTVSYTDRAFTNPTAHLVMLTSRFRVTHSVTPPVERIAVNDPHWWETEYLCHEHGHQVVCPFSTP